MTTTEPVRFYAARPAGHRWAYVETHTATPAALATITETARRRSAEDAHGSPWVVELHITGPAGPAGDQVETVARFEEGRPVPLVSRAQAEAVLAAVRGKWTAYLAEHRDHRMDWARTPPGGDYVEGGTCTCGEILATDKAMTDHLRETGTGPTLHQRGDGHWEIVWEEGPSEWAVRELDGTEVDVELTADVQDVKPGAVIHDRPATVPAGVFLEAVSYHTLGLYPKE